MQITFLLSLTILHYTVTVENARILFVPLQMASMVHKFHGIAEELACRGHEVYSVLSDQYISNTKTKAKVPAGITVISYHLTDNGTTYVSDDTAEKYYQLFQNTLQESNEIFANDLHNNCKEMMLDMIFLLQITKIRFDIAIVDGLATYPCLLTIPAYLDIPFVVITPEVMPDHYRIPHLPSFVGNFYNSYSEEMTFIERLHNLYIYFIYASTYPLQLNDDTLLNEYGRPDVKMLSWKDMLRKAELIINFRTMF
jgi:hypothetical protein